MNFPIRVLSPRKKGGGPTRRNEETLIKRESKRVWGRPLIQKNGPYRRERFKSPEARSFSSPQRKRLVLAVKRPDLKRRGRGVRSIGTVKKKRRRKKGKRGMFNGLGTLVQERGRPAGLEKKRDVGMSGERKPAPPGFPGIGGGKEKKKAAGERNDRELVCEKEGKSRKEPIYCCRGGRKGREPGGKKESRRGKGKGWKFVPQKGGGSKKGRWPERPGKEAADKKKSFCRKRKKITDLSEKKRN